MADNQLKKSTANGITITLISHSRESYEINVLGGALDGESESYFSYVDALFAFEKMAIRVVLEEDKT